MVNDNSASGGATAPSKPKKSKTLTASNNKQDMFKSIDDIKALIVWAKSMGLKRIRVGDVEAEISEITYALAASDGQNSEPKLPKREELSTARTWADDVAKPQPTDEEDLFWSSGS